MPNPRSPISRKCITHVHFSLKILTILGFCFCLDYEVRRLSPFPTRSTQFSILQFVVLEKCRYLFPWQLSEKSKLTQNKQIHRDRIELMTLCHFSHSPRFHQKDDILYLLV